MEDAIDSALSFAEGFFQRQLLETESGQRPFQYLGERGYGRTVAEHYGLGWAPDSWEAFLGAARSEGFSAQTLEKAGLVVPRKSSGYYDRFRNRLIFPLYSREGGPIGFAGRILDEDAEAPKYINSPETERYQKDRYLYGMWRAEEFIEKAGTALVTEGYTDVITLQSEGIKNVVASSGTALTETQAQILSEAASTVVFAYDPDEAGIVATIRGMKRSVAAGLMPRGVVLPDGHDPHEYAREGGLEEARWWIEKRYMGLTEFMLQAERRGDYDPDPSVAGEVASCASTAPTKALEQMILLDCGSHVDLHDTEVFEIGSQSSDLDFAT